MTFLVILDPGQSKPAGVPASLGYPANVDANAVFMGELRPHVPAVPH
jgi:hypothetical protein